MSNQKKHEKIEIEEGQIIPLSPPPMCAIESDTLIQAGEEVEIQRLNASKLHGVIQVLDIENRKINILPIESSEAIIIEPEELKLITFPKLREWETHHKFRDPRSTMVLPPMRTEFEINFTDGENLKGMTISFSKDGQGLFLFPSEAEKKFIYTYIPFDAIESYRIGAKIVEILEQQDSVSEEQVSRVEQQQKENRERPLGDYLRKHMLVTADELEKVLSNQKSKPNIRLGEFLINEDVITQEQLKFVLEEQKQHKDIPIGELLVKNGYVTWECVQQAQAYKLGIPFVDVANFDLDRSALALIPEKMVREYVILPLYRYEGKLVIAMANPMSWKPIEAVSFAAGMRVETAIAVEEDIQRVIDEYYIHGDAINLEKVDVGSTEEEEAKDETANSENQLVQFLHKMILDAYYQGASDIHIEPGTAEQKMRIRFRKDGLLFRYTEVPSNMRRAILSRIKVMSHLDITEKRLPMDGKIDFKRFSTENIELRVATIPVANNNEGVVLRILRGGEPVPLQQLLLSEANSAYLEKMLSKPYGLIFTCGPTGSGKTTTLHSILSHINTEDRKIWTVEDPVEIVQQGLSQVQVATKIGLTFASALRALLRADPDVIMVGETRDEETARICIEASLTGHLVFSTLHTNSAPETITRLLAMGMDPFNFADAMVGIIAQRLARRLCTNCCQPVLVNEETAADLLNEYCHDIRINNDDVLTDDVCQSILSDWQRFKDPQHNEFVMYAPVGCSKCSRTGYSGRFTLHELLYMTDAGKHLIMQQAMVSEIKKQAIQDGMRTLRQDGIEKVLQGYTNLHEVRRITA